MKQLITIMAILVLTSCATNGLHSTKNNKYLKEHRKEQKRYERVHRHA